MNMTTHTVSPSLRAKISAPTVSPTSAAATSHATAVSTHMDADEDADEEDAGPPPLVDVMSGVSLPPLPPLPATDSSGTQLLPPILPPLPSNDASLLVCPYCGFHPRGHSSVRFNKHLLLCATSTPQQRRQRLQSQVCDDRKVAAERQRKHEEMEQRRKTQANAMASSDDAIALNTAADSNQSTAAHSPMPSAPLTAAADTATASASAPASLSETCPYCSRPQWHFQGLHRFHIHVRKCETSSPQQRRDSIRQAEHVLKRDPLKYAVGFVTAKEKQMQAEGEVHTTASASHAAVSEFPSSNSDKAAAAVVADVPMQQQDALPLASFVSAGNVKASTSVPSHNIGAAFASSPFPLADKQSSPAPHNPTAAQSQQSRPSEFEQQSKRRRYNTRPSVIADVISLTCPYSLTDTTRVRLLRVRDIEAGTTAYYAIAADIVALVTDERSTHVLSAFEPLGEVMFVSDFIGLPPLPSLSSKTMLLTAAGVARFTSLPLLQPHEELVLWLKHTLNEGMQQGIIDSDKHMHVVSTHAAHARTSPSAAAASSVPAVASDLSQEAATSSTSASAAPTPAAVTASTSEPSSAAPAAADSAAAVATDRLRDAPAAAAASAPAVPTAAAVTASEPYSSASAVAAPTPKRARRAPPVPTFAAALPTATVSVDAPVAAHSSSAISDSLDAQKEDEDMPPLEDFNDSKRKTTHISGDEGEGTLITFEQMLAAVQSPANHACASAAVVAVSDSSDADEEMGDVDDSCSSSQSSSSSHAAAVDEDAGVDASAANAAHTDIIVISSDESASSASDSSCDEAGDMSDDEQAVDDDAAAAAAPMDDAPTSSAAADVPSRCPHCARAFDGGAGTAHNIRVHIKACEKKATTNDRAKHAQKKSASKQLSQRHSPVRVQPSRQARSTPASTAKPPSTPQQPVTVKKASTTGRKRGRPRSERSSQSRKRSRSTSSSSPSTKRRRSSTDTNRRKSKGFSAAPSRTHAHLVNAIGYDLDKATIGRDADLDDSGKPKKTYVVEKVVDRRFNKHTLQYEYRLRWKGWSEDDDTWEATKDTDCKDLIHAYHLKDEQKIVDQLDEDVEKQLSTRGSPDSPAVCFHRDGFCVLRKPSVCLTAAQVAEADAKTTEIFNKHMLSVRSRDLQERLETKGFDTFKLRGRGRYDLTLPADAFSFLHTPPWLPTVESCLGGRAVLRHAGVMISMPASETQQWHSDGPHKVKHCHLPAYLLNVFVPLVDMRRSLGGTEFFPGSHVHFDLMVRSTAVTPLLHKGQVLIFDYRIRHRGIGNTDTVPRPVLYFTYSATEAIIDEKNFSRARYQPLPPPIEILSREERLARRKRAESKEDEEEEEEKASEIEDEDQQEEKNETQEEDAQRCSSPDAEQSGDDEMSVAEEKATRET